MRGPLSGVRVLDISRAISGPYGAMILADLGAEVIHIESPEGEISRFRAGPNYKGESFHYLSWNRNKKNMVLDFTTNLAKEAETRRERVHPRALESCTQGVVEKKMSVPADFFRV